MVNVLAFFRETWVYVVMPTSVAVGYCLDKWNGYNMGLFKNKSKLYLRELKLTEEEYK